MTTIECPNCGKRIPDDQLIPIDATQVCPLCREEYLQRIKEGLNPEHQAGGHHLRRIHLKHEASIRSVGYLYFLSSITLFVMMVVLIPASFSETESQGLVPLAIALFYLGLSVVMFFMGLGIRKLKRWVRVPATILACLGLLSFPVGTLINGYILSLIWSAKGKMVFSEEYAEVIAKTPDMKYKGTNASKVLLILVVVILLLILASILIPSLMTAQ